jgi:hypothetical protein
MTEKLEDAAALEGKRETDFGLASKKWTPNQAALMFVFSCFSSKATGEI